MPRLLALSSMLTTLIFGGASAISQDAQSAYQFATPASICCRLR